MSDHSYVHNVTRQSGSNFYYSFFALPKDQREAMTAVYAFCRQVDDAVDAPDQKDPQGAVAWWRDEIAKTYDGKPTQSLTRSLAEAIERFQLSREYFDGILNGVEMDLRVQRYATYDELTKYCYHVAGEVGLLCMEIFGYRSERLKNYAVKMGLAFQLTNILRDVQSDAARGRIYLPMDDLARFGVSEEWILQNGVRPLSNMGADPMFAHFKRLMSFEARRARDLYREVSLLPTLEERPSLKAAEIMKAIYENVLARIERRDYNVFGPRIRVPTLAKIVLALQAWWSCR